MNKLGIFAVTAAITLVGSTALGQKNEEARNALIDRVASIVAERCSTLAPDEMYYDIALVNRDPDPTDKASVLLFDQDMYTRLKNSGSYPSAAKEVATTRRYSDTTALCVDFRRLMKRAILRFGE